jgi:type III secretion protein T
VDQLLSAGYTSTIDMTAVLQHVMTLMALCTARIYAAFMIMPATSDDVLQGRIRPALCLVFGLYVAWGQPANTLISMGVGETITIIAKEALIGVLLGYAASTVFWIAEGVGSYIDNQAGFNNVQQTNPLSGSESTPMGNLLLQLSIAGFFMLGGLTTFVGLLFDSFAWWPLRGFVPDGNALLERFVTVQTGGYIETMAKVASPVMLVLVLIDLGFGLIGKTAEKIEVNALAQPVKAAVAIVMLSLLISLFFQQARPAIAMRGLADEIHRWLPAQPAQR